MTIMQRIAAGILGGLMLVVTSCVIVPREGFYDRDHHRYYHDHGWHECGERDNHCR
jgi:hypothetical protein